MRVAFAQREFDCYHCIGTNLYKISVIMEQFQVIAFLRANVYAEVGLNNVLDGDRNVSDVVVADADIVERDLTGWMNAAEAKEVTFI